jgi:hypothetical protein
MHSEDWPTTTNVDSSTQPLPERVPPRGDGARVAGAPCYWNQPRATFARRQTNEDHVPDPPPLQDGARTVPEASDRGPAPEMGSPRGIGGSEDDEIVRLASPIGRSRFVEMWCSGAVAVRQPLPRDADGGLSAADSVSLRLRIGISREGGWSDRKADRSGAGMKAPVPHRDRESCRADRERTGEMHRVTTAEMMSCCKRTCSSLDVGG